MVVFDQLNPMYAKYYTQAEAKKLLVQSGFKKINFEHRHEYSWSIIGEK
jgi:hypothetical protein